MEGLLISIGGFSGVVLAEQGGEVILSETFGLANPELDTHNTLDTPFFYFCSYSNVYRSGGFGGSTPLAGAFLAQPDEISDMTLLDFEPML